MSGDRYWFDATGVWIVPAAGLPPSPVGGLEFDPGWWRTALICTPGLMNAHTHPLQSGLRFGLNPEPVGFDPWLRDLVLPYQAAATPAVFHQATTACLADNVTHGATRVHLHCKAIHSIETITEIARACAASPLNVTLHVGLYPDQLRDRAWLADVVTACRAVHTGSAGTTVGLGPVNLHNTHDRDLDTLTGIAAETGWPVHTHVSETPDAADSLARLIRRDDPLTGWQLVHCLHEPETRLRAVLERGATIVLCHLSNAFLGTGQPAPGLITHPASGPGRITLGSDGTSSSGQQSVAASAYTGWLAYGATRATPRPSLASLYALGIDHTPPELLPNGQRLAPDYSTWQVVAPIGHPATLLSEFLTNRSAFRFQGSQIRGRFHPVASDSSLRTVEIDLRDHARTHPDHSGRTQMTSR